MDPVVARPLITFIVILLVMLAISFPFVDPGAPEWYLNMISLTVLLAILGIVVYDVRKQAKRVEERAEE